ncbi:methyltransferase domain-containing protein [Halorubrum sp. JWXQ-INN 858]|uniref:class I SAM-dependent methyltransferase n=1 Tax=Halorubrum sp. JWXQ-INN 858 TaxID=2690782 RepID=UPI001356D0A6|nr:class I SAM-dependent methyltransferase [Halorubrum sp. JWXQ-INN 858]MWV64979.1 methyltransferase domain-containing protein [Halorubrum sp. JWXQ-INN 858]
MVSTDEKRNDGLIPAGCDFHTMTDTRIDRIERRLRCRLEHTEINENSSLQSLDELLPILVQLYDRRGGIDDMVDLGCGSGGFTRALGDLLECDHIYGIETDLERRRSAKERGVDVYDIDLECAAVPFDDGEIDLVISFGLLEHLTWYDNTIRETARVLRDGGHTVFSAPNLAGWTNRLSLLLGKQPRNVEFSTQRAFGILPYYPSNKPLNHVHAPTVGAFRDLLNHHAIDTHAWVGLHPYQRNRSVAVIDRLVSRRPSLCRRFAVLGRYTTPG